jgi:hypothetical protein
MANKKYVKTKIWYTFEQVSQDSFDLHFLLKYNDTTHHCIPPKNSLLLRMIL